MTEFSSYVDHLRKGVAEDLYMGYLVWYSVPDATWVNVDEFNQIVTDILATNPESPFVEKKKPLATDVFRRGCTKAEKLHRKMATNQSGVLMNFHVRDAGVDETTIYRQIVREFVDRNDHVLSFEILGDLRFNKITDQVSAEQKMWLSPDAVEAFEQITDSIKRYLAEHGLLLNSYAMREVLRQALEGPTMAIRVRPSGGVFFVKDTRYGKLKALEELCEKIGGPSLHITPLIDDTKQRGMLKQAFEDESIGEIRKLMGDMSDMLKKKGKVTIKQAATYNLRYRELREKLREYSDLLDDSLSNASTSLELCSQQMTSVLKRSAIDN